jgi:hypothetical protein
MAKGPTVTPSFFEMRRWIDMSGGGDFALLRDRDGPCRPREQARGDERKGTRWLRRLKGRARLRNTLHESRGADAGAGFGAGKMSCVVNRVDESQVRASSRVQGCDAGDYDFVRWSPHHFRAGQGDNLAQ